ncbi:MAG: glycosyltransferase family 4 protein [Anaerolineae bacterium]|nr:glycosyltransferase family 4 protein [Anaerolineae bacterium]NUQ03519.1 glycosyltransferase family 4 protein [Anaerolineae bacterium]
MHILFVANYSPPYGGGIQFVIASLTRALLARGHEVSILAADTGIPRGISEWKGARLIGVPASNLLERRSVPYPLFSPPALRRALNEVLPSVDVVHIHGMLYLSSVMAAWSARRGGRRVILTEHVGSVPYNNLLFRAAQASAMATLGRACLRGCDEVVVLNGRVAAELQPLLPRRVSLRRIPNGVDAALFHPPSDRAALRERLDLHTPTILFAGRVVEKKGIDLVLDAARRLPEWTFAICGQDSELLSGTPANVRIGGKLDQAALAEWYGAADLLLLPSEGEGFPLVVQEALACGLPVMVTDDATNREYLSDQVAFFVRRHGAQITGALRGVFDRAEDLASRRAPARRWAVEHFDWERTVEAYLHLYQGK